MKLVSLVSRMALTQARGALQGLVPYGGSKADGSHDHRSNRGADRTPAQKSGDAKRARRPR